MSGSTLLMIYDCVTDHQGGLDFLDSALDQHQFVGHRHHDGFALLAVLDLFQLTTLPIGNVVLVFPCSIKCIGNLVVGSRWYLFALESCVVPPVSRVPGVMLRACNGPIFRVIVLLPVNGVTKVRQLDLGNILVAYKGFKG